MHHIQAPASYEGPGKSLFLAGGISGCLDWQSELVNLLKEQDIAILNPRRNVYISTPEAEKEQISWEYGNLRKADAISFWFPKETVCPITLYELGAWSMGAKRLFVGVHPDYQRRTDIEIQTGLARPDITIAYDLRTLTEQISRWNAKSNDSESVKNTIYKR